MKEEAALESLPNNQGTGDDDLDIYLLDDDDDEDDMKSDEKSMDVTDERHLEKLGDGLNNVQENGILNVDDEEVKIRPHIKVNPCFSESH